MEQYTNICNSLVMNDSIWYKKISDNLEYYSYGCPDSRWDLETIIYQLDLDSIKEPTIFIDTCCGIDLQENISKMLVNNLAKIHPEKHLILTGCGVNYDRDFYKPYGLTLSNQEKFHMKNYPFKFVKRDIFLAPHSHGAVKIQDGCYHNCSYCVICKVRSHYTFTFDEIDKQVRTCINNGWTDILLFGTDICLYYTEDKKDLLDLCKHLLDKFPEITSLKLDSINPEYKRILELVDFIKAEPRFQKDLDLAIQSCSNTILKSIKRRYSFADIQEIIKHGGDELFFASQLITGLPGETEKMFQESLENLKKINPELITLCPYSRRKGTEGYSAPNQVPHDVAKNREHILRETFNTAEYTSQILFDKFKPKTMDNAHVFCADLYDDTSLQETFKKCEAVTDGKQIIVLTDYDRNKNWYHFEVNVKMLMVTFGAKIITNIVITDDILDHVNVAEFASSTPTYLDITFDKLKDKHDEDTIVSFFRDVKEYKLDDVVKVLQFYIKAGNIYQANLKNILSQLGLSLEEVVDL